MSVDDTYRGVWPVMLTPFDENRQIDWESLKKLIDWYIAAGVHGLFANCQSSEMFFLSDAESLQLTRFVVDYVAGRVPVVASGHTACGVLVGVGTGKHGAGRTRHAGAVLCRDGLRCTGAEQSQLCGRLSLLRDAGIQ